MSTSTGQEGHPQGDGTASIAPDRALRLLGLAPCRPGVNLETSSRRLRAAPPSSPSAATPPPLRRYPPRAHSANLSASSAAARFSLSPSLPGFRFRIFDFPVTIGVDFLLISVLLGLGARPGLYLIEWVVVVAVSILIHELGHAFALRHYNLRPEIRLWGMGGLTMSGFALPPRKSILVSLAGPCIGIPVALAVMVIRPWLPQTDPIWTIVNDLVAINLFWGLLNLLPLGGLDGGNIVTNSLRGGVWASGVRRPGSGARRDLQPGDRGSLPPRSGSST
jgi:Zn-dependent protease